MAGLAASAATNYQRDKEEDDDYMGDLSHFLPPQQSNPPKLCKKAANEKPSSILPSKNKSKNLSWQELRKLEREGKQQQEDELTRASIENPIPQSNIGFKMLKQMGYTPGSALGKDGCGIAEPVGVDSRRSRAGIGLEDPHKEKREREEMEAWRDRKKQETLMEDFGLRQKSQWLSRRIAIKKMMRKRKK